MKKSFIALTLICWQTHALDITGTVQDKFYNPLAGARVCGQGSQTCVTTDAAGKFHWTGASSLRPLDPALRNLELGFRNGTVFLRASAAGPVRAEWLGLDGRRLGAAQTLSLSPGENAAPLPAAAPQAGIAFLRISGATAGGAAVWKVLFDGSGATASRLGPAASATLAGAAKTSAGGYLDVSLDKYKASVYAATQDTEADAVVVLRTLQDRILFDGHGLDAWTDKSGGAWKAVGDIIHQDGGAGVLATKDNFGSFRLSFVSRMLEGSDHKNNILLWCKAGSTDNRTMGGIQFQPPMGSMWDYTKNNDPNGRTQTRLVPRADLDKIWDPFKWSRCEALADMAAATIRFACCMVDANGEGPCTEAREHVLFKDPSYARSGPIALMIHDGKQKQEYKHIEIEPDPINADKILLVKK